MSSQLTINMETVAKFMHMSTSSIKGITVDDVCAGTGLSKSTVYRVIKKHPGIKPLAMQGKQRLYYFDHTVIYEPMVKASKHKRRLEIDEATANHVEKLGMVEFLKRAQQYTLDGETPKHRADFKAVARVVSTVNNSGGDILPTVDEVTEARQAIESLLAYGAFLQIRLGRIKRDKRYMNDSEFWNLFKEE